MHVPFVYARAKPKPTTKIIDEVKEAATKIPERQLQPPLEEIKAVPVTVPAMVPLVTEKEALRFITELRLGLVGLSIPVTEFLTVSFFVPCLLKTRIKSKDPLLALRG